MRLSPLCDRWDFTSSTTSMAGSLWPSQRQFQHRTRPSYSATYVAWGSWSTFPRAYCYPVNEYHSWAQLWIQFRWQKLSQRSEPRRFSATWLSSRKGPPVRSKLSRKWWALWQQLRHYFSWVCFACDPSSSVWSRGFHAWRHGQRTEGRLSLQTIPTSVGERCAKVNRPSVFGLKWSRDCTSTA